MIIPIKNPELLRQVRQRMLLTPSKFNWKSWVFQQSETDPGMDNLPCEIMDESCGTQGCVAGWLTFLACPAGMVFRDFAPDVQDKAFELLLGEFPYTNYEESIAYNNAARTINDFLFCPWGYGDAEGNILMQQDMTDKELEPIWLMEAIARIDWILDGKDTEDYVIQHPELIRE